MLYGSLLNSAAVWGNTVPSLDSLIYSKSGLSGGPGKLETLQVILLFMPLSTTPHTRSEASSQHFAPAEPAHDRWTWVVFAVLFALLVASRFATLEAASVLAADKSVLVAHPAPARPINAWPHHTTYYTATAAPVVVQQ